MVNFIAAACLSSIDWASLRTSSGTAENVPLAIETLVTADTEPSAREAYWRLDNEVVVQEQLFEAAPALVPVILALLAGPLSALARYHLIELLLQIGGGVPHEEALARGSTDLGDRCREHLREGLWLLYGMLMDESVDTRSAAVQLIADAETDRARLRQVLQVVAAQDPDGETRRLAANLLQTS